MCLTNTVAANFTANALLAIGAKPAMVEEPSEAEELASIADSVLVNLGTVHPLQAEAMRAAIRAIKQSASTPWVLDPVACHLLSFRGKLAKEMIAEKPTLVRGNHAEINYLTDAVPDVNSTTILSTGEVDIIYYAAKTVTKQICGGVEMLQTVTATGCAQGAICAAMLGMGMTASEAAEAASKLMKRAGETAWPRAKTPGSFKVALIDALYELRMKYENWSGL